MSKTIMQAHLVQANLTFLKQLSQEIHELDIGNTVDVIHTPDAARFVREYVAGNKPVLIKGAIDHWPALHEWSCQVLEARAGHQQTLVDVTPNGFGDAVTPYTMPDGQQGVCFCIPQKRRMPFKQFLSLFFDGQNADVPYLQVNGWEVLSLLAVVFVVWAAAAVCALHGHCLYCQALTCGMFHRSCHMEK